MIDAWKKILNEADVISFDIFDTAIIRPFYTPSDIFYIIENDIQNKVSSVDIYPFHDLRIIAEKNARNKVREEEITLDDIYAELANISTIDNEILVHTKNLEMAYELQFCKKRESIYEVYKHCKSNNKKVIFTSDMYLDEKTVRQILQNAGYDEDPLFLSSSYKKTKRTGTLFDVAFSGINPQKVVHIGDNYTSDYLACTKKGVQSVQINSPIQNFEKFILKAGNISDIYALNDPKYSLGLRCAYALIANKFFDSTESPDCYSPAFIGYVYLGLHLYGLTHWLITQTDQHQNIVFCARDGYLPMKSAKIMLPEFKKQKKIKYFFTSRLAMLPFIFRDDHIELLISHLDYSKFSPAKIIQVIHPFLKKSFVQTSETTSCKTFATEASFLIFLKNIKTELDAGKLNQHVKATKRYFDCFFSEKSALFDIGYSIRVETILHKTYGYCIDSFYVHQTSDMGLRRSATFNIPENSFYSFVPKFSGGLREQLFSKIAPSCTGYETSQERFKVLFSDNYFKNENAIIKETQNWAITFINDFCKVFKTNIPIMKIKAHAASNLLECFLNTANKKSMKHFKNCCFDDFISFDDKNLSLYSLTLGGTSRASIYMPPQIAKSKIKKAFFYLISDPVFFKHKVLIHIKNRVARFVNILTKK